MNYRQKENGYEYRHTMRKLQEKQLVYDGLENKRQEMPAFYPKKTNADRIRSMSDEELSEFLTHMNPTNCQDCAFSHGWRCQPDRDDYSSFEKCKEGRKRWLKQPFEGE